MPVDTISSTSSFMIKTELIEHIRGRARGLSVFVLADMWAQPMIKLDRLYNLLLPGTSTAPAPSPQSPSPYM